MGKKCGKEGVTVWLKVADCKSVGISVIGSNLISFIFRNNYYFNYLYDQKFFNMHAIKRKLKKYLLKMQNDPKIYVHVLEIHNNFKKLFFHNFFNHAC